MKSLINLLGSKIKSELIVNSNEVFRMPAKKISTVLSGEII